MWFQNRRAKWRKQTRMQFMQDAWRLRYLGLSPPSWLTRSTTASITTSTTTTTTPPSPSSPGVSPPLSPQQGSDANTENDPSNGCPKASFTPPQGTIVPPISGDGAPTTSSSPTPSLPPHPPPLLQAERIAVANRYVLFFCTYFSA